VEWSKQPATWHVYILLNCRIKTSRKTLPSPPSKPWCVWFFLLSHCHMDLT